MAEEEENKNYNYRVIGMEEENDKPIEYRRAEFLDWITPILFIIIILLITLNLAITFTYREINADIKMELDSCIRYLEIYE